MLTELEKLDRARMYMQQLAEGVDPIGGQELPQDSALNQLRLSRCFFYVADILGQVIANGGQVGRRAGTPAESAGASYLPPFALTAEQRALIPLDDSVMVKRFTESINALADLSAMRRLKMTAFGDWLVREGYMREDNYNGKRRKVPTEQGCAAGISEEQRNSQQGGYYTAVLYNQDAQRLLIKHLDEIIAISNGEG